MTNQIQNFSLCDISNGIRERQFTAVEVMEQTLDYINRIQPKINAFISIEEDAALDAARLSDIKMASGDDLGLLHGVPLAHKDLLYREGRASSCGSIIRKKVTANVTSTALEKLDASGALEVGSLNMSEFAAGGTGHNRHYGHCLNPWNTKHVPGGSSSGSGAAVAARMVSGSLGSDTGGSVRIPAALCGVVGIKPTDGRVSRYGVMPRSWSTDTLGPMARTVRDVARILGVISGYDSRDPQSMNVLVPDYESGLENSLKGVRIGVARNFFCENLSEDVSIAMANVQQVYSELGAILVEVSVPDPNIASKLGMLVVAAQAASLHEEWLVNNPEQYQISTRTPMETGLFVPATRYIEALRLRGPILREFEEKVFSKVDLLQVPTLPMAAPTVEDSDPESVKGAIDTMAEFPKFTRPISYIGIPAISVPCGFSSKGLPIGFQLVGRPFSEGLLLNAAHVYQRETDWHEYAPKFN